MSIVFPGTKKELPAVLATGFKECIKRPITVQAMKLDCEFQVDSLEGNYAQGKPGDYLMCGVDGELYICDKEIFEKSYDFCPATIV